MKNFFTIIALLGLSSITFAQRLVTEDFNYAVGQLTTGNLGAGANVSGGSWVWFSGTTVFLQVTAGNLTFPNYVTLPSGTSNKVTLTGTASSAEDAYTLFATQPSPAVGSSTVYVSFILKVADVATLGVSPANGEFFAAFLSSTGISGSTATYNAGRVYIRKGATANTFALGVSPNSPSGTTPTPAVFSPTDYSIGTPHLVTLGYTFVAGPNNDIAKLFVDAPYSATEPIPDALSVAVAGTEPADINRFVLREGNTSAVTTPNADIDAIKVSTNYADATLTFTAPLTLTSFKGYLVEKNVQLNWTSENEQNVRSYTIERSTDGRSFSTINVVDAKNTTQASYIFSDIAPVAGTGYYRLSITDLDGVVKLSNVVSINNRKGIKAQVFPNPVADNLSVSYTKAGIGASINIFNASGQQVKTFSILAGSTQTSLLVNDLVKGNYILAFNNNGESTSTKFIKN